MPNSSSTFTYHYTLSGTLSANDDLAILFPLGTTGALSDSGAGSPDFSTFVLQPDSSIPADGEFDIVSLVDSPDLSSSFFASFDYSGNGTPGSQAFTLYDGDFNVLQTGVTEASSVTPSPIPEPASLYLLATGAVALLASRRRAQCV